MLISIYSIKWKYIYLSYNNDFPTGGGIASIILSKLCCKISKNCCFSMSWYNMFTPFCSSSPSFSLIPSSCDWFWIWMLLMLAMSFWLFGLCLTWLFFYFWNMFFISNMVYSATFTYLAIMCFSLSKVLFENKLYASSIWFTN